jgi:hypothetical protein
MANNILITPASSSIQFSGSADNTIRLQVEDSGSVAFYGNSGSLFGISDSLSGSLMSVNDISGFPILEVTSDDTVTMGTFNQNALVVTGSLVGVSTATPTKELTISGSISASAVLTLQSQDPLPSDITITGSIAVSSSGATEKLYFHDGSAWKEVSFV